MSDVGTRLQSLYEALIEKRLIKNKREFSEKLGLDYGSLNKYLTGKVNLSINNLNFLNYEKLGINLEWLLTGKGQMFSCEPKIVPLQFLEIQKKEEEKKEACLFYWNNYKEDDLLFSKYIADQTDLNCIYYVFCESNYDNPEELKKHQEKIKEICGSTKLVSIKIPKSNLSKENFGNIHLIKKLLKTLFGQIKEKLLNPSHVYISIVDDGFESPLPDKVLLNEALNYTIVGMISISDYFDSLFGKNVATLQVISRKQELNGF